jgi:hypothetical protein
MTVLPSLKGRKSDSFVGFVTEWLRDINAPKNGHFDRIYSLDVIFYNL